MKVLTVDLAAALIELATLLLAEVIGMLAILGEGGVHSWVFAYIVGVGFGALGSRLSATVRERQSETVKP